MDVCVLNLGENSLHTTNGVSLMLIGGLQHKSNGVTIAPVGSVINVENGIVLNGIVNVFDKLNGYGLSYVMLGDTINGLATSLVIFSRKRDDNDHSRINGVAIGVWVISVAEVRGVSVSVRNDTKVHKGFSIGGYNKTKN
ncbi:hypothetical protein [Chitinophaga pinensis]|uniref:Uncharacterized protein n=1 Tax=Chitinophaga pinensis TaxID=79329 RepID=A0A5C6LKK2_9BACT|nr:hypothetical protein [Chitinophaga pinensis]TWV92777.1 hypothetical protein FEF09_28020 [Chitinophaga pinensis]